MPVKFDKREYRKIDAVLETRTAEDGQMIVEGYATTFNQPYLLMRDKNVTVMEQMDLHATDKADKTDTIMQYDHEGPVFARVSNGTLELIPDEHGLKVRANLGGTERGRQLYEEIRGGYVNKMSIGFNVKDEKRTRTKNEDGSVTILRTLLELGKIYDVSAVSIPATDATEISARTISDGLIAEAMREAQAEEERQRRIEEIRKILKGEKTDDE